MGRSISRLWIDQTRAPQLRDLGYIAPRGGERTIESLRRPTGLAYVVTGSVAAQFDAPFAPARLLTAYVADPAEAANVLERRPTDSGANVVLAANTDDFALDRARDTMICAWQP